MKQVKHTVMTSEVIIAWIKTIIYLLYKLHLILNSREDERTMYFSSQNQGKKTLYFHSPLAVCSHMRLLVKSSL